VTLAPFRGRCHTCGHDHDAETQHWRDVLDLDRSRWRPIETAPKQERVLLFSPARNLSNHPDQRDDIRVARAVDFTWATHWMPLPAGPAQEG
jgi:hypothetical protein